MAVCAMTYTTLALAQSDDAPVTAPVTSIEEGVRVAPVVIEGEKLYEFVIPWFSEGIGGPQ